MSLIPRWKNRLPSRFAKPSDFSDLFGLSKLFEDEYGLPAGISVSSDDKNVYIEADVPGLTAKEVDVSIDSQGVLWVKGVKQVEEKERQYYKKSHQSFSYALPLWDEIDISIEPQAVCKNGVMKITFAKRREETTEAKRISVKEEK